MPTKEWREKNKDKVRAARRRWYWRNREHAKQKVIERKERIRDWFQEYKKTLSCVTCGEDHPACLVFHHKDPNEKEIDISKAWSGGWGIERILKEIDKCDALCANCHRKLHASLR